MNKPHAPSQTKFLNHLAARFPEVAEIIHAINDRGVYGTVIEATGDTSQFVASAATDGAGIYEVTLDQNLRYTGTSTDGATLEATTFR